MDGGLITTTTPSIHIRRQYIPPVKSYGCATSGFCYVVAMLWLGGLPPVGLSNVVSAVGGRNPQNVVSAVGGRNPQNVVSAVGGRNPQNVVAVVGGRNPRYNNIQIIYTRYFYYV